LTIINLLFISALAAIFIIPNFQKYQELKAEFIQKTADVKAKRDYSDNLKDSRQKISDLQPKMSKIETAVPGDLNLPVLFDYFQKVVAQEGLVMRKISLGSTILALDNPAVQRTTVSLEILGPYSSFKGFLNQMEKSSRLIQVESLAVLAPEEGQNQDILTYRLTVSVNFLNVP